MTLKTYFFLILLSLAVISLGSTIAEAAPENASPPEQVLRQASKDGRCPFKICFALDDSSSLSPLDYMRQRFLAIQMVKRLSRSQEIGLAAVQYGIASKAISRLTHNRREFISRLRSSVQKKSAGTFLVAGINNCFSEMFDPSKRSTCGKNKIIVMGDGKGNIGSDPAQRSRLFAATGGEVFAIAFGKDADVDVLSAIAGDADKLFFSHRVSIKGLAADIVAHIGDS